MSVQNKLIALRHLLSEKNLDGVIIPHTDEFGSEYLPPNAERLAWLTGFTGSSGAAIVLADTAMVMTDGRYTIQIQNQVDSSLFDICDMANVTLGDWLASHAQAGQAIGFDPKLHTKKQMDTLRDKVSALNIQLIPLERNLIDAVWVDRPVDPVGAVEVFPDAVAGASSLEKRQRIAAKMREERVAAVVMTLPDSLCWLLNVRGSDIDFNPLVLSYGILHDDAGLDWYVDDRKLSDTVRNDITATGVRCHPIEKFPHDISKLSGSIQYDDQRSSVWIYDVLQASGVTCVAGKDPCILPKACKTPSEQLAIKQAHIRDGVALVRFLYWLDAQDVRDGHVTELWVEEKLEECRRADRTYRGPSFSTIAGWAEHGAIIHYRATSESNAVIGGNGFLLLDSGGQYEYGTTDITRTIVIGDVTPEMKDRYTRVLKGHIALASAKFAPETEGCALDNLARQPLIDDGLNFAHGTGHGVGCFLCVHEEASSISPRGKDRLRPGMLLSNEPGYYQEGGYGVRHENLMLCQEDSDGSYYFETVTCVPFDVRGIDWDLMSADDVAWLRGYHHHVVTTLSPFLDEDELRWLRTAAFCAEIG